MLWQGTPRWTALARRAFHIRKVAVYFLLIALWQVYANWSSTPDMVQAVAWTALLAAICMAALALLAWAMARATVYTVTSQRVVMRIGVALAMIINFPFAQVRSAELRLYSDGTGDIPLRLADDARPSFILMWPHVRPWRFSPPQPMLRVIPEAGKVAELLANALKEFEAHKLAEEVRTTPPQESADLPHVERKADSSAVS